MQQHLTKKPSKVSIPSGGHGDVLNQTNQTRPGSGITSGSHTLFQSIRIWPNRLADLDPKLRRTATHIIMIAVILSAFSLRNINIFDREGNGIYPLTEGGIAALFDNPPRLEASIPFTPPSKLNNLLDSTFPRAAVPHMVSLPTAETEPGQQAVPQTLSQRSADEIVIYVVEAGDTIFGIADKFDLVPETIMWSNDSLANNPDLLSVGQELIILPVDGVYHQVGSGDTVAGIAATFKTDPEAVLNHPLNELDPEQPIIIPGQWLIVPNGSKPFVPRTVTAYTGPVPDNATIGSGSFGWPATGAVFQGYWSAHPGIDIAAWIGAPVAAADSGHVVAAGWDNTGYGNSIVVDHGNGFQTLYAHLQDFWVSAGDNVTKGQQIGTMGNTGNSTGPHLHFEVRQGTVQRNPVGFLP